MPNFHSVRLDADKCKGCTNCVKRCSTEAIRVRDGKAVIIEARCIDCGECIRTCPNNAKQSFSDALSTLKDYDYAIALAAPSLFGQFKLGTSPASVIGALKQIGFDEVFEVAVAADYVTCAMDDFLRSHPGVTWISSSCPAVVRLIQVRFPDLLKQLLPLSSPMELAAQLAKRGASGRPGMEGKRIGAFFITPCPAKTTAVHRPEGEASSVDGTISIAEVYTPLLNAMKGAQTTTASEATGFGFGWAMAGGEARALGGKECLAVDGVHDVISVLEELELGRLDGVKFIEAQACPGGCLGGPLTLMNPFLGGTRLQRVLDSRPATHITDCSAVLDLLSIDLDLKPRPMLPLDAHVPAAIERLQRLEAILEGLPGLDCGACGAPSCRALAEDIVRELATETDCVIKLRERVQKLAEEMVDLSTKLPPAMGRGTKGRG